MFKDKFKDLGTNQIIENAERLNNYMSKINTNIDSVNQDLKELLLAFNTNMLSFSKRLTKIEEDVKLISNTIIKK